MPQFYSLSWKTSSPRRNKTKPLDTIRFSSLCTRRHYLGLPSIKEFSVHDSHCPAAKWSNTKEYWGWRMLCLSIVCPQNLPRWNNAIALATTTINGNKKRLNVRVMSCQVHVHDVLCVCIKIHTYLHIYVFISTYLLYILSLHISSVNCAFNKKTFSSLAINVPYTLGSLNWVLLQQVVSNSKIIKIFLMSAVKWYNMRFIWHIAIKQSNRHQSRRSRPI